jgi:Fic family protein
MAKYIYEYSKWTNFLWQDKAINAVFGEVKLMQGKIIGQMNALGFTAKEEATLSALTLEVIKSSEIEGELLNYDQVRSSIARRLGINTAGLVPSSRHIEGVVEMMLDATQRYTLQLTEKRLFGWHAALFPTGYSGPYAIEVGKYRKSEMQVVSGAMGKEKIHYQAIKHKLVKAEMDKFLDWFNNDNQLDPVIKAAIAHFWFIIIHPFDDGNGRIGRAITDMLLARSESSGERFYSMSSQILIERKRYYEVLQKTQHSTGDITEWLEWFLHCLKNAMHATENTTQRILSKAEFWRLHQNITINERQRTVLNRLFDGFDGKLQSSKWAKITKVSTDTALRDIKDLIEKGILQETSEGGRNANYKLINFTIE